MQPFTSGIVPLILLLLLGLIHSIKCAVNVNSRSDIDNPTSINKINSFSEFDSTKELDSVLQLLPEKIREAARQYIASRLRRIAMYPRPHVLAENNKGNSKKGFGPGKRIIRRPMLGSSLVPVIPDGDNNHKWIPGELIASQITRRELKLIDESVFGPLKSATMFPSVMSTILVFNKRYNPERLAEVLKVNFGIEAEPNGLIKEASLSSS